MVVKTKKDLLKFVKEYRRKQKMRLTLHHCIFQIKKGGKEGVKNSSKLN